MTGERLAIHANAQLVVDRLGPLAGIDFGFNGESVRWLEGFIECQRERPGFDPDDSSGLVQTLGSFLGECIAVNASGHWEFFEEEQTWGVRLPSGSAAFPFSKVAKQLRNGIAGGDSIYGFYEVAIEFVAKGGLDR